MRGFFHDIGKLLSAVKEMGVLRTGKYALFVLRARLMRMSDQKKDSHLGVKTRENVQLETLDVCSENKQHGFSFVPSSERMVRVMLATSSRAVVTQLSGFHLHFKGGHECCPARRRLQSPCNARTRSKGTPFS